MSIINQADIATPSNSAGDKLFALGALAMANANKADKLVKRSRADFLYVVSQSLAVEFHAFYQKADKTVVCNEWPTIAQVLEPGYVDSLAQGEAKARTAIYDAVIFKLTGVTEPSTAQRDCRKAAFEAANGLFAKYGPVTGDLVNMTAKGNLQVPYAAMHDAPKADAPESEHDNWNARKESMFTVDGTRGNSFSELRSKVAVKVAKLDDRAGAGQGKVEPATWSEAVKAKLRNAEYKGQKGMEWAAYISDLSGSDLIRAAMLLSAHDGDNA